MKHFILTVVGFLLFICHAQTPTIQAGAVSFSKISCDQIKISWKKGNGNGRTVWLTPIEATAGTTPTMGRKYGANSKMGRGSKIGTSTYCVYDGAGDTVLVSDLLGNQTYAVSIYEYDNTSNYNYLIANGTYITNVINDNLIAGFTVNQTIQCFKGNSFTYTNTSSVNLSGTVTYLWTLDTAATYTSTHVTHAYKHPDINEVTLTASLGNCSSVYSLFDTTVIPWQVGFKLAANSDPMQCPRSNHFYFDNTSMPPSKPIYGLWDRTRSTWSTDNGHFGTIFNFDFQDSTYQGSIDVQLKICRQVSRGSMYCCDSTSKTVGIYKSNFNRDSVIISDSVYDQSSKIPLSFRLNQTKLTGISWSFGDGDTAKGSYVTHSYKQVGVYTVTCFGLDSNGCEFWTTKKVRITDVIGIEENTLNRYTISPNPVTDYLQLNVPDQAFTYSIFSSTGVLVKTSFGNPRDLISVSDLPEGLYILRVNNESSVRFIKR